MRSCFFRPSYLPVTSLSTKALFCWGKKSTFKSTFPSLYSEKNWRIKTMFEHFGTVLLRLERYLHYLHLFSVQNFDRLIFTNLARKIVAVMIFFLSGFFGTEKSSRNLSSLLVSYRSWFTCMVMSSTVKIMQKEMQNFDHRFPVYVNDICLL